MSMLKVADVWYCSFDELVERCSIYCQTIKNGIHRGSSKWQSIVDPDDRRKRLIRYDTMADKYKGIVRRVLCNGFEPWEMAEKKTYDVLSERSLPERLQLACIEGYKQYIGLYPVDLSDAKHRQKTQIALARAAAIVETIGRYVIETGQDWRDYTPYERAIEWLTPDYDQYFPIGHQYLPMEVKNLKERVLMRYVGKKEKGQPRQQIPLPITEVIHLPRSGNQNRDKFGTDEQLLAWIIQARRDQVNWTDIDVARKIRKVCELTGKTPPSIEWFAKILATPKVKQLTTARYGHEGGRAALYQPYITLQQPMYAGDCWQVDATRINFVEHKAFDGKGTQFLFIVVIRDVYSGEIVGVDFGITENRWTYINAFKMAVQYTGHLPYMLVYDRFPGHVTDEVMKVLQGMEAKGVKLIKTSHAQGKSAIERWFDTLQTVFLSQSRYYYGQGICSTRPFAHRAPQYLTDLRKQANKEGWDFDQSWQEAWRCVDSYRQTSLSYYSRKHAHIDESPMELYQKSEKPHVIPVEIWEQSHLFWLEKTITIQRDQIKMQVDHQEYIYPIYEMDVLYGYSGKEVSVRYDDLNLDHIYVFEKGTDQLITVLGEVKPAPMFGAGVDRSQLAKQKAINKRIAQQKQTDSDALAQKAPDYMLLLQKGHASKDEQIQQESLTTLVRAGIGAARSAQENRKLVSPSTKGKPTPKPIELRPFDELPDYGPNQPGVRIQY